MNAVQLDKGIKRLERQLEAVNSFDPNNLDPRDAEALARPLITSIEQALVETFGQGTTEFLRYEAASDLRWVEYYDVLPHRERISQLETAKTRSIQLLEAALELLRERREEFTETQAAPAHTAKPPKNLSKRIFIVHGQDDGTKEAVARFISSIGYDPVILHEQANKGRTIIQKFRDEASDVGFAIVLMTPDDETASGEKRARQNVILELGFFLGALGPDRVAAIVKGDLERPSDFDGVVYTPFTGSWKADLAKELQAAGYDLDWNKVMKG
ncbi:nucleotide-binding protein [Brucella pseudogrignonensis]|nr:nucleotide-binding protein [Ochrobactrum sp. MYb237]PQZ40897.1 nucleotide-binding protein [Brucella pseudogrignonensis]PRA40384.1 nucleotide-binding protein [Brucella pseudogrignonensis]PRA68977.1 nucleotide-binding protein [Brucella pseudogrignonensis]